MATGNRILEKIITRAIVVYQVAISPFMGQHCRFFPSCSQYCKQAIAQWGIVKGMGLACARVCRCHPFRPGGYDPVPSRIGRLSPLPSKLNAFSSKSPEARQQSHREV